MSAVVTCPACQQKARVPESMLGQPVKCPACGATFGAPGEPPATELAASPTPEPPPDRPPLPADADDLRAARAAASVQLVAHCLYAGSLALFLVVCLLGLAQAMATVGPRGPLGDVLSIVLMLAGTVGVLIAGLLNLIGTGIGVLSPPAQLARGLAIAGLVLATTSFLQLASTVGWAFVVSDQMPHRLGSGGWGWMTSCVVVWLLEIARLAVLALYWRAVSRILRDARGSAIARRLAIGGPAAQLVVAAVWIVLAVLGAPGEGLALLALVGWLAMQLIVVLGGIGVAARLRRRLRAAVPD